MPGPIVQRLNAELHTALAAADVQKALASAGSAATPSSPDAMRERVVGEIARWKRVIEQRGIRVE